MVISELLTLNSNCMSNNSLSFVEGNESESSDGLFDVICPLMESKCQISSESLITASDEFKCSSMENDSITTDPSDVYSMFSDAEMPLYEDRSWVDVSYKGNSTINHITVCNEEIKLLQFSTFKRVSISLVLLLLKGMSIFLKLRRIIYDTVRRKQNFKVRR